MSDPSALHAQIEETVESRIQAIQADPARFEPYDLNGDGVLDEKELERLRQILIGEEYTRRVRARAPQERDDVQTLLGIGTPASFFAS